MLPSDTIERIEPTGFGINHHGLHLHTRTTKKGEQWEWICSPIEVLACTRNEHNQMWGRLIQVRDVDGTAQQRALSVDCLHHGGKKLFSLLMSLGVRTSTKRSLRQALIRYIQEAPVAARALCTPHTGWYENHFVLPDAVIPATPEICLQRDLELVPGFYSRGTLHDWKEQVAAPAAAHPHLVLALCSAFTAPLLPLLNAPNFGLHFAEPRSNGQPLAVTLAASVWGEASRTQPWEAQVTKRSRKPRPFEHKNGLLCLDRLSADHEMQLKTALAHLSDSLSPSYLLISSGEPMLHSLLPNPLESYLLDMPPCEDTDHDNPQSPEALQAKAATWRAIEAATQQHYGIPIREFLLKVQPHQDSVREQMQLTIDAFKQRCEPITINPRDPLPERAATCFAHLAAAGELAIENGILPYPTRAAFDAVLTCYKQWKATYGGLWQKSNDHIQTIREFFKNGHEHRFETIGQKTDPDTVQNPIGYKRILQDGSCEFFVDPDLFHRQLCAGMNVHTIRYVLRKQCYLWSTTPDDAPSPQSVPGGRRKMYHVSGSVLR